MKYGLLLMVLISSFGLNAMDNKGKKPLPKPELAKTRNVKIYEKHNKQKRKKEEYQNNSEEESIESSCDEDSDSDLEN